MSSPGDRKMTVMNMINMAMNIVKIAHTRV